MTLAMSPFLMFEGNAEEAMNFYVSVFEDGEIHEINRYTEVGPGPEGTVIKAIFSVAGQLVICTDSFVKHKFSFTPSISMFVECESVEEIVRRYGELLEGGAALMPLDNYGFSLKFGWVRDKFGVTWQLNLK